MKLSGEHLFAAPRLAVWTALQDPATLAAILPGCERLERTSPDEFEGLIRIRIGPVQGDFLGKVRLEELNPPASYRMVIDGRGAQGFVKATAAIALAEEAASTRLTYDADAQVGGRIASVGQRLVESSARAIVKQSLDGLDQAMRKRDAAAEAQAAGAPEPSDTTAPAAKPSQASFAAGVAREVAKDLVPPAARRALLVGVLLIIVFWVASTLL